MTTDLIPTTTQTTDEKRGLALLKAVGLDRVAPEQRELALAIADRYGLDLMLKHLVLIDGKPFITRDGLLFIAHRSGVFDGISVTTPEKVDKFWRCTATVWRRDMARPFIYPGRFPVGQKNDEEMCIKVGESMSLRRAFNVSAPTVDERWASDDAGVPEQPKSKTLAELARLRAAQTDQAPPEPATEAAYVEVAPEPTPEPSVAAPALCGSVAGDGLMAGAVCILPSEHNGFHRTAEGTWPR